MTSLEKFRVVAECGISKARSGVLNLPHYSVETPVFMPVGTKGCMKGVLPEQLEELNVQILLGNTYHLGLKPGPDLLIKVGGLHHFMNWKRAILTDSGGFQMVSLLKLSEVTEEGVRFKSPYSMAAATVSSEESGTLRLQRRLEKPRKEPTDTVAEQEKNRDVEAKSETANDMMLLTPEKSMQIQNAIGADIIMQLDDVVSSTTTGPRVAQAMRRSLRWLDRCRQAHSRPTQQYLFPITQGGLELDLRKECIEGMTNSESVGFAIGGLSGGEEKSSFWKIVFKSTEQLPNDRPRYVMGVGYAEDLVVCCALGADMFDCVFPTRTARFGCALVDSGQLNLKNKIYQKDFRSVDEECPCRTCRNYTRSYLHHIAADISVAARLISVHNICYQMTLMKKIRESIGQGKFPEFVQSFMLRRYAEHSIPNWIIEALASVNIRIPQEPSSRVVEPEGPTPPVAKKRRTRESQAL